MSKHTPGPWTYFVGNANGRGLIRIEADHDSPWAGHHIASMPRGKASEVDARLIAASPDMRHALEVLSQAIRDERDGRPMSMRAVSIDCALQSADKALAKAEGRS